MKYLETNTPIKISIFLKVWTKEGTKWYSGLTSKVLKKTELRLICISKDAYGRIEKDQEYYTKMTVVDIVTN